MAISGLWGRYKWRPGEGTSTSDRSFRGRVPRRTGGFSVRLLLLRENQFTFSNELSHAHGPSSRTALQDHELPRKRLLSKNKGQCGRKRAVACVRRTWPCACGVRGTAGLWFSVVVRNGLRRAQTERRTTAPLSAHRPTGEAPRVPRALHQGWRRSTMRIETLSREPQSSMALRLRVVSWL